MKLCLRISRSEEKWWIKGNEENTNKERKNRSNMGDLKVISPTGYTRCQKKKTLSGSYWSTNQIMGK